MSAKFLILRGDSYRAVSDMFLRHDFETTFDISEISTVDGVVFTGGSDVSPYIYGEEPHGARGCDPVRDELEKELYLRAQDRGIPSIGICRGGQLLNVLNGGKMIQDIGYTVSGVIASRDESSGNMIGLLVDHHQGIVETGDTAVARRLHDSVVDFDICDAVYYPETKSFCFQPHPEWSHEPTESYFFKLLERYGIA